MPRQRIRRVLTKRSKELEGLPQLFEQLNNLSEIVELDEIVDDVLMPAAKMGRDEIKDTAPIGDKPHPPGWLKIREATFAAKGDSAKDAKGPSVLFGVNAHKAPHAIWQEFGTAKMSAHPFFRPARAAVRPALAATIKDGILRLIDKAVK